MEKYIKPYTKTQIARAYGIDVRTFNKWLKPLYKTIGKPNGRLFTPLQVRLIFRNLGTPQRHMLEYINL